MNRLQWMGPFVLLDYLLGLLNMTGTLWPVAGPGVYVVTSRPWTGQPTPGHALYTGASGNLLSRIGNFLPDVLGFYGPAEGGRGWVGRHSGAQTLWQNCHDQGGKVGELLIGWAATSDPCHWCMEKELARLLKPSKKNSGRNSCCCPVAAR